MVAPLQRNSPGIAPGAALYDPKPQHTLNTKGAGLSALALTEGIMPGLVSSARGARSERAFGIFVHEADQEPVPGQGGEMQPEGGVELEAPDVQAMG